MNLDKPLDSEPQVSVNKGTIATILPGMWKDSVREGMQKRTQ